jgi:hypothetical protein
VRFGYPADLLNTLTPIWNNAGLAAAVAGTAPDYSAWHADRLPSGEWVRSSRSGRLATGSGN